MSDVPGGDPPSKPTKAADKSAQRTRGGKKPQCAVKPAERISVIMQMMAAAEWYGYLSHVELAKRWNVAVGTVRNDANEAHRQMTADPIMLEQRRFELAQYCAARRKQAAEERCEKTGLADISAGIRAAELEAKLWGIDIDKPPAPSGDARPRVEIRILTEDQPTEPTK